MPIYEYECGACGVIHDVLQKISDAPPRKCPACGRLKLKRIVSAPKFRLKGEGWYETDFKTENQRNLAGDDKPPADKAESKADTKASDTKASDKKPDKPAKPKGKGGKSKKGGKAA